MRASVANRQIAQETNAQNGVRRKLGKSEGSEAGAGTEPESNACRAPGHGRNGAGKVC
jgi:hypothetical protein